MKLEKRDCKIKVTLKPLGAELLYVCFDFGYDRQEFIPSTAAISNEQFGPITVAKMLAFEQFAGKIKEKYSNDTCWYLYSFAVDPAYQGKGYGSMLLKPMLAYLDRAGHDCYLETLKDTNVELYKHYGFELMESTPVPGTDMILYAMLRKAK